MKTGWRPVLISSGRCVFSRPVPTCVPWPGYAHNITPGKSLWRVSVLVCLWVWICACDLMFLQWRLVQIPTGRIEMVSVCVRYVTDGSEGGVQPLMDITRVRVVGRVFWYKNFTSSYLD